MHADPLRAPPPPVVWSTVRRVHLMGICGSAMAALAALLQARGFEVRGTDAAPYPPMSDFLAARHIPVMQGYDTPAHLDWGPDLVIVGNVIRPTYPEALALRDRHLPFASLPETLAALLLPQKTPVVVTGTHGKTTTSALTAWLLECAGLAPSFFIGGLAGNLNKNHHLAEGIPFVVEGDEYDTSFWDKGSKFLHYNPQIASINNLELDHVDIFADIDAIEATFARFATLLPASGHLVVPAWETRARRAAAHTAATLHFTHLADAAAPPPPPGAPTTTARDLIFTPTATHFTLALPGHAPLPITLPALGRHNVANALIAATLATHAGADPATFPDAFSRFVLPFKRLTLRGTVAGIPVIDDFAHHPSAIAVTLAAVRQRYPGRRLVALFEAQSNTARRKVFQDGFARALAAADRVYFKRALAKASDPLPPEDRLDLPHLAATLSAAGTPATIIPEVPELASVVAASAQPDDVILTMSGRDFEGIHALLLQALAARFEDTSGSGGG